MDGTAGFFTKLRDEADSSEEKKRLQVFLDAFHFIALTGQSSAFGEYLEHVEAGATAVSSTTSRSSHKRSHPSPPRLSPALKKQRPG